MYYEFYKNSITYDKNIRLRYIYLLFLNNNVRPCNNLKKKSKIKNIQLKINHAILRKIEYF